MSDPQATKTIQNNLKELLKNIKKYDEYRYYFREQDNATSSYKRLRNEGRKG